MASSARNTVEGRSEQRDEVHHRARAVGPDGRSLDLLVVNISAGGLMARCEEEEEGAVGDTIRVHLPVTGAVAAEIRWSLGGRIGCRFDRTIPLADYYALLAALTRP